MEDATFFPNNFAGIVDSLRDRDCKSYWRVIEFFQILGNRIRSTLYVDFITRTLYLLSKQSMLFKNIILSKIGRRCSR